MDFSNINKPSSHGNGKYQIKNFNYFGKEIVIEDGVLVFHPENISIADKVYIGHQTILKGYYKGELFIGEGTWIGQYCFIHSAGSVKIGKSVGIGPYVKILTSVHEDLDISIPYIVNPLKFSSVLIGDGADIGIGSIILPGVMIGEGAVIGAGSVVTKNVEAYTVCAGVPARFLRNRTAL